MDAICDGERTIIGGIMEHVEEAGVHSGDSACILPPRSIPAAVLEEIADATRAMAKELNVVGLMNVQYAIKGQKVFILEVNPRASRTIPFVSKATGVPLAKLATKVMLGKSLEELGLTHEIIPDYVSVKEAVLPFDRFPDVDTLLGPRDEIHGARSWASILTSARLSAKLRWLPASICRPKAPFSSVCRIATKQRWWTLPAVLSTRGSRSWPPAGRRTTSRPKACRPVSYSRFPPAGPMWWTPLKTVRFNW